jgi:hypothetical protein
MGRFASRRVASSAYMLEERVDARAFTYSDGRVGKVSDTEVGDLESGRLQLGDMKSVFCTRSRAEDR